MRNALSAILEYAWSVGFGNIECQFAGRPPGAVRHYAVRRNGLRFVAAGGWSLCIRRAGESQAQACSDENAQSREIMIFLRAQGINFR
jgi:ribosomal protein S14